MFETKYKEMRTGRLRKLTEPLVYVLLVAAFGFITTFVNHNRPPRLLNDPGLVSYTIEQQLDALLNDQHETYMEVSL